MGEMSPPTAADYAWDAANTAQRGYESNVQKIKKLEETVERLLRQNKNLHDRLIIVEGKLKGQA